MCKSSESLMSYLNKWGARHEGKKVLNFIFIYNFIWCT